jgi:hypothetical protein
MNCGCMCVVCMPCTGASKQRHTDCPPPTHLCEGALGALVLLAQHLVLLDVLRQPAAVLARRLQLSGEASAVLATGRSSTVPLTCVCSNSVATTAPTAATRTAYCAVSPHTLPGGLRPKG